jgi:hypothetical protein
MTQDEILDALEDERENFLDAIEGLSDEAQLEPGVIGDWSIKDILHHLTMWEAEAVKLMWEVSQGLKPSFLNNANTTTDELNAAWALEGQARTYDQIWDDFEGVRKQTIRRLSAFTDQDLNDPKRYPWLKDHPLWDWIAENSFAHEKEHTAQIKEWRLKKGL